MKYFFYILFFFFNHQTIFAIQNPLSIDIEIHKGLDDIYNLKFDEAEIKFKNLQETAPDNLSGYFYESILYFYKAMPTRDEATFEKYLDLSDNVIERAENILDKDENNYDALYYKGLSHSFRSLLMLSLNKSLLKAASNGNDGYRILSGLIEIKPDYYDAYMGLGLYKIAIALVPEKFQWLLSLIGFNGNIKEGMRMLNISMRNGKYSKVESKVFLSILSLKEREDADEQSLIYSRELAEDYPISPVFKVFYASLLLQYGKAEQAIKLADEALNINNYSFQNEIKKYASAVIGLSYFRLNNFEKVPPYLEEAMKCVVHEDRYNLFLFTLGNCYELTGNRAKALEKYKGVRNDFINERDGELDKFFYRYAQNKIKAPLRDIDSIIIVGMNLRESNKFSESADLFSKAIDSKIPGKNISNDDIVRLYFDLGLAYVYQKELDKAEDCFNKCVSLNPETETWLIPHSYFELGKIYDKKGNKKKSEEMFDKIFEYDDFDFESFLEMRLANYVQ